MSLEKKIDNFIEKLKNFDKSSIKRKIFNPYAEYDENDISPLAPCIRCVNLKNFLLSNSDADYILIAESPSSGARYTGIAMTSEKVIEKYNLKNLSYTSFNQKKTRKGEITASKVWEQISKSKNKFVLWNSFAFNIVENDKHWFENPEKKEVELNIDLLKDFMDMFPKAKIVAVGKTAQNALNMLNIKDFECVRHPSNDFKNEFKEQFKKYL